jgi:hypothetical protein
LFPPLSPQRGEYLPMYTPPLFPCDECYVYSSGCGPKIWHLILYSAVSVTGDSLSPMLAGLSKGEALKFFFLQISSTAFLAVLWNRLNFFWIRR